MPKSHFHHLRAKDPFMTTPYRYCAGCCSGELRIENYALHCAVMGRRCMPRGASLRFTHRATCRCSVCSSLSILGKKPLRKLPFDDTMPLQGSPWKCSRTMSMVQCILLMPEYRPTLELMHVH
jgi:hypothetical protein